MSSNGSWLVVGHHFFALRWRDNVRDHQIETVRVIGNVLHRSQVIICFDHGCLRLLVSIVVLLLETGDIGAELDGIVWELVLKQFIEVDLRYISFLGLHIDFIVGDLLNSSRSIRVALLINLLGFLGPQRSLLLHRLCCSRSLLILSFLPSVGLWLLLSFV